MDGWKMKWMEEPIFEEDLPVEVERAAAAAMDGGTSDRVLPGGPGGGVCAAHRAGALVVAKMAARGTKKPGFGREGLFCVRVARRRRWRSRLGERKYNFEFRIAEVGLGCAAAC